MDRHLFALACGAAAAIIPNNHSNIPLPILGAIFALLFTKIVYGDYDIGYAWTVGDLWFFVIVGGLGAVGAYVTAKIVN